MSRSTIEWRNDGDGSAGGMAWEWRVACRDRLGWRGLRLAGFDLHLVKPMRIEDVLALAGDAAAVRADYTISAACPSGEC